MTTRRDTRVPPKPYQAAPDHWPSHLRYLHNPIPSPSSPSKLPLPLLIKYCSPSFPPPNAPPPLEIQLITSKNHPAFGQSGLFNSPDRELEKGTWIRDYIGVVYEEFEGREWSDYDLCLERGGTEIVGIDSEFAGNEARFVNDYRGIHEKPNCIFELRRWSLPSPPGSLVKNEGIRMAIWAGPKGVAKGEELCVSYGNGFWSERGKEMREREMKEARERDLS